MPFKTFIDVCGIFGSGERLYLLYYFLNFFVSSFLIFNFDLFPKLREGRQGAWLTFPSCRCPSRLFSMTSVIFFWSKQHVVTQKSVNLIVAVVNTPNAAHDNRPIGRHGIVYMR
jgi:hypothetical protein